LRLRKNWDVFGVFLLVLSAIPAALVLPKTLVLVARPGYMDDDWHLDEVFKASHGIWIGRDVAFTHGPLFQLLSGLPAYATGVSVGTIYATWNTVPMWCAIGIVYLCLRLLLPEQPPWRRCLLLLLLCVFWSPSLRMAYPVLVFAATLRAGHEVMELRWKPYLASLSAAALAIVGFLFAGDTGVFCVAAVVAAVIGLAFEARASLKSLVRVGFVALYTAVFFLIGAIGINSLAASPLNFRYWRESLAMIQAYRWATSFPMEPAGTLRLLLGVAFAAIVFVIGMFSRLRGRAGVAKRSAYLLGAALFSLAALQTALVRSDDHHIASALSILALFAGAILFSFDSRWIALAAAVVAVVISAFGGWLHTEVTPSYTFEEVAFAPAFPRNLLSQFRKPLKECPYEFVAFDRACLPQEFTPLLQQGSEFLQQHAAVGDPIAIFPYQTRYGLTSGRNVAGGLMQAYTASGPTLAKMEIAGLEKSTPPAALYFPDANLEELHESQFNRWRENGLSMPVDAVSSFTRTPEVWLWLQRHYHAEQTIHPGIIGLRRDDARAGRISMDAKPLGIALKTYDVPSNDTILDLGAPTWSHDTDFLRLRVTLQAPFWWRLRKPERLQLLLRYADGSSSLQWFVVPPNVATDVWFFARKHSEANYFDADPAHWRRGPDSAVVSLKMLITPLDWASQQPSAVTIESADAVSVRYE
jgi:hypothetical protein